MRATIEQIRPVADRIKTGWEMCDSWLQRGEKEAMVCQTLVAARNRFDDGKGAASRQALARDHGRLAENSSCFGQMVEDGFFEVEVEDGACCQLVYPTVKLVQYVEQHLNDKRR